VADAPDAVLLTYNAIVGAELNHILQASIIRGDAPAPAQHPDALGPIVGDPDPSRSSTHRTRMYMLSHDQPRMCTATHNTNTAQHSLG